MLSVFFGFLWGIRMIEQIAVLASVLGFILGLLALYKSYRKTAIGFGFLFLSAVAIIVIRGKWAEIAQFARSVLNLINNHISLILFFIVIFFGWVAYHFRNQNKSLLKTAQMDNHSLNALESKVIELSEELSETQRKLDSFENPGMDLYPWEPGSVKGKDWADCDYHALEYEVTNPHTLNFEVIPQNIGYAWRAGMIFLKNDKRDNPILIFHAAHRPERKEPFLLYAYWDSFNLIDEERGHATLKAPKSVMPLDDSLRLTPMLDEGLPTILSSQGNTKFRISFCEDCLILSAGEYAWRLTSNEINLSDIGTPYLAQWNEKGWTDVSFKNIKVKENATDEMGLLEALCECTNRITTLTHGDKISECDQEIRDGLQDAHAEDEDTIISDPVNNTSLIEQIESCIQRLLLLGRKDWDDKIDTAEQNSLSDEIRSLLNNYRFDTKNYFEKFDSAGVFGTRHGTPRKNVDFRGEKKPMRYEKGIDGLRILNDAKDYLITLHA